MCKQIHRFVQYVPKNCFKTFVHSVVNARRERDENPNSSLIAESMKLLANNSYHNQIMDRSLHTMTKFFKKKTHSAINSKTFKHPNHITDQLYAVKLVKPEIERRDPIIVEFFAL